MQQPDYRDQSDPEETDETYKSRQSICNNTQNQDAGQMEQEEKETDHPTVSTVMNNLTETNSNGDLMCPPQCIKPVYIALISKQK